MSTQLPLENAEVLGEASRLSPGSALIRPRKLHAGHFAFMRAVVQGIDTRAMWQRYLRIEGEHTDARVVRRTIGWMREEFAAAAKRHGRFGQARLILIDVSRIPEPAVRLPSLEEFARAAGLEEFSQDEQLAHFEARYGKPSRHTRRRGTLVQRQLDALRWLEQLVAEPPGARDGVGAWFDPRVADRLEAKGIDTLARLLERINGAGRRWWFGVPGIGAGKAARIEEFLTVHRDSIGVSIGAHVAVPRAKLYAHELDKVVPRATAVVPLDKLLIPAALDGREGRFRAERVRCLLRANNDYDAVQAWLAAKHSAHTKRAYRKEVERFLLWAILEHHKPLSSMSLEDCIAYRDFLADPQPRERWCGPRARARWSPLWRPFEGPLSVVAQRQALVVLKVLYKFLVDQGYMLGNPWNGVSPAKSATPKLNAGRSFTRAQWEFIEAQLALLADTGANQRLRLALHVLYDTGLRLSEVVAVKLGDLSFVAYPPEAGDDELIEGWLLHVVGKGDKARTVPVSFAVMSELSTSLVQRGLDVDPEHPRNREAYLLGRAPDALERAPWAAHALTPSDPAQGISAATLADQIKQFFQGCARVLEATDPKSAARFARASTHWLRHTHGTHAVAAGTPLDVVQQNLGHASLNTTTVYVTSEDRRRMKAMRGFWGRGG